MLENTSQLDFTELIKTFGVLIGIVTTAGANYFFKKKEWLWHKKDDFAIHSSVSEYKLLRTADTVKEVFIELFDRSEAERVLGLTAFGGLHYETIYVWCWQHKDAQYPHDLKDLYNGLTIDDEFYISLLERLENELVIHLRTPNLRGMIREYYEAERVVESVWGVLVHRNTDGKEIVYMSISTHNPAGFTRTGLMYIDRAFREARGHFKP